MPDAGPASSEGKHQRIAGYEVLAKVGEGGMGVVFKARQVSLDRIVALKVLPAKLTADARFVERFLREAKAIAKLSHPNIVRIYEVDRSKGGIHYYAMEYVDGESVGSLLKRKGALGVREAARIVMQVARALDHAHAQGFVHRDVKPDNVLLDRQGEAKLADLGLARSMQGPGAAKGPAQAGSSLTMDAVVGTPYYMSPEQAEGKPVDARSDLYALGATFYHLLAGTPPFVGDTAIAVITKHLTDPRPEIRKVRPEVPEELSRVIGRMMKVDPRERYPDAKALLADLSAWAEGGAPRRPDAPGGGRRRRALLWAGGALLATAGIAAFVTAQGRARREREARDRLAEAEAARAGFSRQAPFVRNAEALRRCAELARSVATRYPGTRAARDAATLDQEVAGVLAELCREEVAAAAGRIDGLAAKRPMDPETFQSLRAETESLDRLAGQADIPADVRASADAAVLRARTGVSGNLADPDRVAALRGIMIRRVGEARTEEAFVELRDFVPEGSPARRNLEKELRIFELRKKRK